MEITSPPPEPKTITVVDFDMHLSDGSTIESTLFPDDTITQIDGRIEIEYVAQPALNRSAETVLVFAQHVLWTSRRRRQLTLPPPEEAKA